MYKLSKRSLGRLEGINPVLIDIVKEAIKNSPYDFGIPNYGGLRTTEDQQTLFNNGVSKCDGVKRKSYHQSGNAFDIYAYVDGKASWNKSQLRLIARHIQNIAKRDFNVYLKWCGDFRSFKDMPHFQYGYISLEFSNKGDRSNHNSFRCCSCFGCYV